MTCNYRHWKPRMYRNVRHRILLTSGLRMQIAATINDLQVTLSAEDLAASLSAIIVTFYWTC